MRGTIYPSRRSSASKEMPSQDRAVRPPLLLLLPLHIDVKHCSRTVDISRILSTNRYSFFFLLLLLFSLAHSPLDHIGAQALLAGTAPHY